MRLPHVQLFRPAGAGFWVRASVSAGAALWLAVAGQAGAQGRLDARYEATLAGIPIGKGAWTVEIQNDQFSASAFGGTSGLVNVFAGSSGTGASQGRVVNGGLVATTYNATTTVQKRSESVHIILNNGNVKESGIDPEPPIDPGRIPVTEAHRRGVYDPMTASLLRVPGDGEVLTPDACRKGAAIFDGHMRYDVNLNYKRMEIVRAVKGYRGPVVVCAAYFLPVAGYIPDRPFIKYLAAQRNIEIAFAPVAGTRVLAPFWFKIPTPLGAAKLEATQFITVAMPPRVAKRQ